MGLDAVEHNEYHYGLIGAYGNRYSNLALANSDLILILGSRLDSRQTGTRPDTFGRQAYKIHVDIDENELNQKVQVDLVVNQNVKTFLNSLLNRVEQAQMKLDVSDWKRTLDQYRDLFPAHNFIENQEGIDPNHFIEKLSEASPENTILVLDVGQHQMWASQSFRIKKGQRILNSGGMGAMGFALPAAIGAAFANPDAMVIVVCGDGGLQVNIQELETIVFHQVNIKVIVMNNKSLGMVRAFQDIYFDGRQQSTTKGYSAPDFCKIANAYDCEASAIKNAKEIESAVSKLSEKDGPYLLEVRLEQDTVVNPKLIVNKPIEDMHPEVSREELRKLMIIDLVEE
jgi:acetolactate synthase-1/2/3 large subunit